MVPNRSLPRRHSLIAVVLVARLRPGPRLIFHYPPSPQRRPRADDWPEQSKYDSEPDPGAVDLPSSLTQSARDVQGISPTGTTDADNEESAPGTLLGYSEDTLQKLLAPGCWADRKKFEVCLNGLTFVGHPVWAAQDGSWSRKHAHDDAGTKQESTPKVKPSRATRNGDGSHSELDDVTKDDPAPTKTTLDFQRVPNSFDSQAEGQTLGTSAASGSDTSVPTSPEPISMFNVVFVLDSARSNDNQQLASDLYNHVARKLSKALHYFQRQSQYVGLQTTTLLHLTAKARQDGGSLAKLNVQAVDRSELAWVLKELYEKISIGEIAGIRLSGMEMSLQTPQVAPPERQDESELGAHSGLLLLQNKAALLLELTHADASPLVMFIQGHTPTKSMQKQSAKLGIPLDEVLGLARHLIKWRKARAIKPLHPRNTYVIGREAPFEQLQTYYIDDYSKRFPLLPSLPQILKVLNGKPIKWGALIMSSDHRTPYMNILAYLVQHRFVEQLKTYGWLQAPTVAVPRQKRMSEEVNENRRPLSVTSLLSPQMRPVLDDDNKRPLSVTSLLSPQMRPVLDDDTISVSSERTSIPISAIDTAWKRLAMTPKPHESVELAAQEDLPERIKDPANLTAEDIRRLRHIRDSVDDQELSDRLPALSQYFDGFCALEESAAKQGLKRSKFETWLDALQRGGYLATFRSV